MFYGGQTTTQRHTCAHPRMSRNVRSARVTHAKSLGMHGRWKNAELRAYLNMLQLFITAQSNTAWYTGISLQKCCTVSSRTTEVFHVKPVCSVRYKRAPNIFFLDNSYIWVVWDRLHLLQCSMVTCYLINASWTYWTCYLGIIVQWDSGIVTSIVVRYIHCLTNTKPTKNAFKRNKNHMVRTHKN